MKLKNKIYMIGNAHLDPVWLWRWQEGYAENRATFHSVLERIDEYEDTIFTSSSAQFFEWIEEIEPKMFEKLKEKIAEGRIVICGGWWVQPDCNIPSGESFARQSLMGQRYFYEKFGITCKVGYCVDSFGHNAMLPQILKLSGMDAYVFMRPCENEKSIGENIFRWEAPDGSSVIAFRILGSYCAYDGLKQEIENCKEELMKRKQPLMCFYGVGNHGGGPTKKNIELIQKIKAGENNVELKFSSPNEYFQDICDMEKCFKIIKGDLQHHASGCYSLNSMLKKLNRKAENELLAAEKYEMLVAGIMKESMNNQLLDRAWKKVLFNQFHDILAGTIIKSAEEDAIQMYGEARSLVQQFTNLTLQKISSQINIPYRENSVPIVVFNPLAWDVNRIVEIEMGPFKNSKLPLRTRVIDGKGNEFVCQKVSTDSFLQGRKKIIFSAKIPALGYKQFWVEEGVEKDERLVNTDDLLLENDFLCVRFDKETGGIESFFDKAKGIELLAGKGALGKVLDDKSDAWSHGVFEFQQTIGYFKVESIEKIEQGEVRGVIQVKSKFEDSELIQKFILYNHKKILEVQTRLNWQEKRKCMKLEFPINFRASKAIYEIPFGFIEKDTDGLEEPMQNYFLVSGVQKDDNKNKIAMAVLNDGKYSGDIKGNILSLTVSRSPVYAHHHPYELEGAENDMYIDQGWQEFTYALVGIVGSWKGNMLSRQALELNQKSESLIESYHEGVLPAEGSFLRAEPGNVIVTSCKKAYDNDGWIIRFYESEGEKTTAKIVVGNKEIESVLYPNQIKTIKLSENFEKETEVDFLEFSDNVKNKKEGQLCMN